MSVASAQSLIQPRAFAYQAPDASDPTRTHNVVYYEWGDANNPNVIFCVHGLTRNARDFDYLAAELAGTHRVIAVDIPGRGQSEWLKNPSDYNVVSYLTDIGLLFQELGLSQVTWVGTSMGAIIGMMAASQYPQAIRKMVLNDLGAFVPGAALARLGEYVGKAVRFSSRAEAEAALRLAYAPFGITREDIWQHLFTHTLVDEGSQGVRVHYDPAIGLPFNNPQAITDVDLWPVWNQVQCPVLLLRGAQSDILPRDVALAMQQSKADVTLVEIPRVGHAPTMMVPGEIVPVVEWIKK